MRTATAALGRLASRRARMVLSTFTAELVTGVLTGVLTGVATTAAIRFPGATVMAVTGFLGAGLLTFPQAIGVVVLANAATAATGRVVTILGLRLLLGTPALPLGLAANLPVVLGRGGRAQAGLALSGVARVSVGRDMMQRGMAAVAPVLARALPGAEGLGGRLLARPKTLRSTRRGPRAAPSRR